MRRLLVCSVLLGLLGIAAGPAAASGAASGARAGAEYASGAAVSKKPAKAKKPVAKAGKQPGKLMSDAGEEGRAERERRLARECKGRPNAGLCEGYARP